MNKTLSAIVLGASLLSTGCQTETPGPNTAQAKNAPKAAPVKPVEKTPDYKIHGLPNNFRGEIGGHRVLVILPDKCALSPNNCDSASLLIINKNEKEHMRYTVCKSDATQSVYELCGVQFVSPDSKEVGPEIYSPNSSIGDAVFNAAKPVVKDYFNYVVDAQKKKGLSLVQEYSIHLPAEAENKR